MNDDKMICELKRRVQRLRDLRRLRDTLFRPNPRENGKRWQNFVSAYEKANNKVREAEFQLVWWLSDNCTP